MKEILVIGAGAAGIMAALAAAESGARVHLFEKMILSVRRWESPVKDDAT